LDSPSSDLSLASTGQRSFSMSLFFSFLAFLVVRLRAPCFPTRLSPPRSSSPVDLFFSPVVRSFLASVVLKLFPLYLNPPPCVPLSSPDPSTMTTRVLLFSAGSFFLFFPLFRRSWFPFRFNFLFVCVLFPPFSFFERNPFPAFPPRLDAHYPASAPLSALSLLFASFPSASSFLKTSSRLHFFILQLPDVHFPLETLFLPPGWPLKLRFSVFSSGPCERSSRDSPFFGLGGRPFTSCFSSLVSFHASGPS